MISVSAQGYDTSRLRAAFNRMMRRAPRASAEMSDQLAKFLLQAVRTHASGRPGPRVITGRYRSSINVTHAGNTSVVGTSEPYAMRLEFGFVGIDSMGRHYHQPAFPHWRPAILETRAQIPSYKAAFTSAVMGGE